MLVAHHRNSISHVQVSLLRLIAVVAALLAVVGGSIALSFGGGTAAARPKPDDGQARRLEEIGNSLQGALAFIQEQETIIAEEQREVDQLKEEKAQLEPLVKAQRSWVDGLLRRQQERSVLARWLERIVSFLTGLLSSMIGALCYNAIRSRRAVAGER